MKGHFKTIRLKDTSGNDFFLLSRTARDHAFYATRTRIRASLGTGLLTIRRLKGVSSVQQTSLAITTAILEVGLVNGFLEARMPQLQSKEYSFDYRVGFKVSEFLRHAINVVLFVTGVVGAAMMLVGIGTHNEDLGFWGGIVALITFIVVSVRVSE